MSIDTPVHPFIRPVDPAGLGERVCHVCGHGPDGDKITADGVIPGRRFCEFRVAGVDAVDAGRVYTRHDEPGATVTTVRGADGSPVAVRHEHMVICQVCLEAAGRIVGLGDVTLADLESDRQRERAEDAERNVARLEAELADVREGARVAGVLSKIFEAERSEKPTSKRSAAR
jgi:hypothetical protein